MSVAQKIQFLISARDNATKKVDSVNNSAKRLTNTLKMLNSVIVGVGFQHMVQGFMTASDEITNFERKIQTASGSVREFNNLRSDSAELTKELGVGFGGVGTMLQRLSQSKGVLKASTNQIKDFTSTFMKLGTISGATEQEKLATSIQLSQALGTGELRGEELRSVNEQMPLVAEAIAKAFGIARGELKKFAEQGLLDSQTVFKALLNIKDKVDTEFGKLAFTFEQSGNIMGNAMKEFSASINRTFDISNKFKQFALGFSDVMGNLGESISKNKQFFSDLFNILSAFAGLKILKWGFGLLKVFMKLNPIVRGLSIWWGSLNAVMGNTSAWGVVTTMVNTLSLGLNTVKVILGDIADGISDIFDKLKNFKMPDFMPDSIKDKFGDFAKNMEVPESVKNNPVANYFKSAVKEAEKLNKVVNNTKVSSVIDTDKLTSQEPTTDLKQNKNLGFGDPEMWNNAITRFQDLQLTAQSTADRIANAMSKSMEMATDAIVKFTQTGKISFSDMTQSILNDLLRIMVRQQIVAPLYNMAIPALGGMFNGGFGGGNAGGGQFDGGVRQYHTGGIAGLRPNEVGAILKHGEEVLPENSPRHRNNYKGMGGGTVVNVRVENNGGVDSVVERQTSMQNGMENVQLVIKNTVRGMLGDGELDGGIMGAVQRGTA